MRGCTRRSFTRPVSFDCAGPTLEELTLEGLTLEPLTQACAAAAVSPGAYKSCLTWCLQRLTWCLQEVSPGAYSVSPGAYSVSPVAYKSCLTWCLQEVSPGAYSVSPGAYKRCQGQVCGGRRPGSPRRKAA